MIKLILSDIDGTIVGENNMDIHPLNFRAIEQLNRKHIPLALVSGRERAGILPIQKRLNAPGPVGAFSGALVYNGDGEPISSSPISEEDGIRALRILKSYKIDSFVYKESAWYKAYSGRWSRFVEQVSSPALLAPDLEGVVKEQPDTFKLLGLDDSRQKIAECMQAIKENTENLECFLSGPTYLEIQRRGVDKGNAVSAFARHYRLKTEEIAAIGDYYNDIGMLKAAGLSIAMENAPDEVKQHADIITDTHAEGGFGKAILSLIDKELL